MIRHPSIFPREKIRPILFIAPERDVKIKSCLLHMMSFHGESNVLRLRRRTGRYIARELAASVQDSSPENVILQGQTAHRVGVVLAGEAPDALLQST